MPCRILYSANIRIIRITSKYLPLKNGRARRENPGKGRGGVTVIYYILTNAVRLTPSFCARRACRSGFFGVSGEPSACLPAAICAVPCADTGFSVTRNVLFRSMKKPLLRRETVCSVPYERLFRILISAKRLTVRELLATPFSPYLRPPSVPSACRLPVRTNDCSFF